MLKLTTSSPIDFSGSILFISFGGEGYAASFAFSLLVNNFPFEPVGYFYSKNITQSAGYLSAKEGILSFNGQLYYNQNKKLMLLDLEKGYPTKNSKAFAKEINNFVKEQKISCIYIVSGISRSEITDKEIRSKTVNVFYMTNDEGYKNEKNLKDIKTAFQLNESERKGKLYKEMEKVNGCENGLRLMQMFVLDKVKFVFLFAFAEENFDPMSGYALFSKIALIGGLKDKEDTIGKYEDLKPAYDEIQKFVKIGEPFKSLMTE